MTENAADLSIAPTPPNPPPVSRRTGAAPRLRLFDWGGGGTPLLLLHGMGGNVHWWDYCAPLLRPRWRPVAVDFRAHGESEPTPDKPYLTEDFVSDIGAAADALGWDRFVLCGHSLGARMAIAWAAANAKRLAGLIVVDFLPEFRAATLGKFERARRMPQPFYPDKESALARFRLEPRGTLLDKEAIRRLAETCIRPYNGGFSWKFDWKAIQHVYGPIWDQLPALTMPLLQVRGEKSTVMTAEDLERINREAPDATGLTIERALHHVPLDAPEELARAMNDFLESRLLAKKP